MSSDVKAVRRGLSHSIRRAMLYVESDSSIENEEATKIAMYVAKHYMDNDLRVPVLGKVRDVEGPGYVGEYPVLTPFGWVQTKMFLRAVSLDNLIEEVQSLADAGF